MAQCNEEKISVRPTLYKCTYCTDTYGARKTMVVIKQMPHILRVHCAAYCCALLLACNCVLMMCTLACLRVLRIRLPLQYSIASIPDQFELFEIVQSPNPIGDRVEKSSRIPIFLAEINFYILVLEMDYYARRTYHM
jgi:hypothetical protein